MILYHFPWLQGNAPTMLNLCGGVEKVSSAAVLAACNELVIQQPSTTALRLCMSGQSFWRLRKSSSNNTLHLSCLSLDHNVCMLCRSWQLPQELPKVPRAAGVNVNVTQRQKASKVSMMNEEGASGGISGLLLQRCPSLPFAATRCAAALPAPAGSRSGECDGSRRGVPCRGQQCRRLQLQWPRGHTQAAPRLHSWRHGNCHRDDRN